MLKYLHISEVTWANEWGTPIAHTMCYCISCISNNISCTQNKGSSYVCVCRMCVLSPAVAIFIAADWAIAANKQIN